MHLSVENPKSITMFIQTSANKCATCFNRSFKYKEYPAQQFWLVFKSSSNPRIDFLLSASSWNTCWHCIEDFSCLFSLKNIGVYQSNQPNLNSNHADNSYAIWFLSNSDIVMADNYRTHPTSNLIGAQYKPLLKHFKTDILAALKRFLIVIVRGK